MNKDRAYQVRKDLMTDIGWVSDAIEEDDEALLRKTLERIEQVARVELLELDQDEHRTSQGKP